MTDTAGLPGHPAAVSFDSLYDEHEDDVYRYCLRLSGGRRADAEDLAQETWLRAWRGLGGFEGRSSPRRWLYTIALRASLERRTRQSEVALDELTDRDMPAVDPSPDTDLRLILGEALESVSLTLRHALILVKVEGLTHREAAEILGVPQGTVQFRVFAGLRQLRKNLQERGVPVGLLLAPNLDCSLQEWCSRAAAPGHLRAGVYARIAAAGGAAATLAAAPTVLGRTTAALGRSGAPLGGRAGWLALAGGVTLLVGGGAVVALKRSAPPLPAALRPLERGMSTVSTGRAVGWSEELAPDGTKREERSRRLCWFRSPDEHYSRTELAQGVVSEHVADGSEGVISLRNPSRPVRHLPAPGAESSPFRILSPGGALERLVRRPGVRLTVVRGTPERPEELSVEVAEGHSRVRWLVTIDPATQRLERLETVSFSPTRTAWVPSSRSVLERFEYDVPVPEGRFRLPALTD